MDFKLDGFVLIHLIIGVTPALGLIEVVISAVFLDDYLLYKEANTVFVVSLIAQAFWSIIFCMLTIFNNWVI